MGVFEAWLSAMIGYLMYPVASAGVIVAVVTVAHDVFRETEDVTDLGSILGFFVIVFVGIFALMAIPNAVTHITGQISLASIAPQALRVAGKPLEKADHPSGTAGRRVGHGRALHRPVFDPTRCPKSTRSGLRRLGTGWDAGGLRVPWGTRQASDQRDLDLAPAVRGSPRENP